MVSLVQWCAVIGILYFRLLKIFKNFACNIKKNISTIFERLIICFYNFESFSFSLLICLRNFLLLHSHGGIELNPGPSKSKENNLCICHWNLNSVTAISQNSHS